MTPEPNVAPTSEPTAEPTPEPSMEVCAVACLVVLAANVDGHGIVIGGLLWVGSKGNAAHGGPLEVYPLVECDISRRYTGAQHTCRLTTYATSLYPYKKSVQRLLVGWALALMNPPHLFPFSSLEGAAGGSESLVGIIPHSIPIEPVVRPCCCIPGLMSLNPTHLSFMLSYYTSLAMIL